MENLHRAPEYLKHHREKILKRTTRILNPLDNHPFLKVHAITEVSRILLNPGPHQSLAIDHLEELKRDGNEGVVRYFENQAKKGVGVLSHLLSNIEPKQARYYGKHGDHDPYEGIPAFSKLRSYNGQARDLFAVIHLAASVGKEYLEKKNSDDPVELHQNLLALFAASVAYAQTRFVDLVKSKEENISDKNKYTLRDQVLIYGMQVWKKLGHGDLIEYLLIQQGASYQ